MSEQTKEQPPDTKVEQSDCDDVLVVDTSDNTNVVLTGGDANGSSEKTSRRSRKGRADRYA